MEKTRTRILILGGGYAGIMSANRLAGGLGAEAEITLVNSSPRFVERLRLHEVATRPGSDAASRHSLAGLLNPRVRTILGTATRIRADRNVVDVLAPDSVETWEEPYDQLIYAVGSGSPISTVPGSREHAHDTASLDGARALNAALTSLLPGSTVVIVGGGATAIELAAELATARPELDLTMVTSTVLAPTLSSGARRYVARARAMRTVTVVEGFQVVEVFPGGVVGRDERVVRADCIVWAASFSVPDLAKKSDLLVDSGGRLVVGADLRSSTHPDISGAGDAAVIAGPDGRAFRMACATAAPQGAHAAANIIASLRGQAPTPFALSYLILSLSLGPGDGVIQPTRGDDSPHRVRLTGWIGAWVNELNTRYAHSILAWERRKAGSYRWAKPLATHRSGASQ
ncbi:MAG: FAD-dependent oxidoreductase [Microbacteriaceae bacterium]